MESNEKNKENFLQIKNLSIEKANNNNIDNIPLDEEIKDQLKENSPIKEKKDSGLTYKEKMSLKKISACFNKEFSEICIESDKDKKSEIFRESMSRRSKRISELKLKEILPEYNKDEKLEFKISEKLSNFINEINNNNISEKNEDNISTAETKNFSCETNFSDSKKFIFSENKEFSKRYSNIQTNEFIIIEEEFIKEKSNSHISNKIEYIIEEKEKDLDNKNQNEEYKEAVNINENALEENNKEKPNFVDKNEFIFKEKDYFLNKNENEEKLSFLKNKNNNFFNENKNLIKENDNFSNKNEEQNIYKKNLTIENVFNLNKNESIFDQIIKKQNLLNKNTNNEFLEEFPNNFENNNLINENVSNKNENFIAENKEKISYSTFSDKNQDMLIEKDFSSYSYNEKNTNDNNEKDEKDERDEKDEKSDKFFFDKILEKTNISPEMIKKGIENNSNKINDASTFNEKKNSNYILTDYSSNESSNNSSYVFEWRTDESEAEDKRLFSESPNKFINENSNNYNSQLNNNNNNINSQFTFFGENNNSSSNNNSNSQKFNFINNNSNSQNLFVNNNNSNSNSQNFINNNSNSQNFNFVSNNSQNFNSNFTFFNKNQNNNNNNNSNSYSIFGNIFNKTKNCLINTLFGNTPSKEPTNNENNENFDFSAMKNINKYYKPNFLEDEIKNNRKKKEKKLFCKNKKIPKWAEDIEKLNEDWRNKKDQFKPRQYFGKFVVENLDLRKIFNLKFVKSRGSSANWRNEPATPDSHLINSSAAQNKKLYVENINKGNYPRQLIYHENDFFKKPEEENKFDFDTYEFSESSK